MGVYCVILSGFLSGGLTFFFIIKCWEGERTWSLGFPGKHNSPFKYHLGGQDQL